uniref:DNA-directed DNA polymerase n=3 Tax=Meloidogyne TaxID=189290 RepID=A0A914MNX3_MELIC
MQQLSKNSRSFFIANLLGLQQGTGYNAERYVERLNDSIQHNAKFNVTKTYSKFMIKDVPADAESLLSGIFQFCVDHSLEHAREKNIEPQQLACTLTSDFLDYDIWVPFSNLSNNTVDAMLNRCQHIAQSKKQDELSLFGAPFSITVTTINKNSFNKRRRIGGAARKIPKVRHQINNRSLIKFNNPDNMNHCLFFALIASLTQNICSWPCLKFFYYINNLKGMAGRFQKDTYELMNQIGAQIGLNEYDADEWIPRIVDHWNNVKCINQCIVKIFIFGDHGNYEPEFEYGPDDYDTPILLYYNDIEKHFYAVKKKGRLFAKYYCLSCKCVYNKAQHHSITCKARCKNCSRVGPEFPCQPDNIFFKNCNLCFKDFNNKDCYEQHLNNGFCKNSKKCKKCGVIWSVYDNTRNGRKGHVCSEKHCNTCNEFHDLTRGCYIKPLTPKERQPYLIIAFDFETTQLSAIHEPNFIAAKVSCPDCIINGNWQQSPQFNTCKICGQHRTITFSHQPFIETTVDRKIICDSPINSFVNWILNELPQNYDILAFSHFGGRFDIVITLKEIVKQGLKPEILKKGNKIYEMKMKNKSNSIIFRDTFNLMPMSLASLVPSFDLNVEEKPFFPHMANRPENYGKEIYPTKNDYLANGMMPEKRKMFELWYEQNKNTPFFLDEALASYCTNDVEILMAALIAFRKEFFEVTKRNNGERASSTKEQGGIDVLREAMTIASACMRHFRTNHLKEQHLALVPERGYDKVDGNQSLLALRFFKWYSEKFGVTVQNVNSDGGEKRIGNYQLDGWIVEENYGIEVNGCVWHGCSKCFPCDNDLMPNGKTAGYLREHDKNRMEFILSQIARVDIYWECEIYQMLAKDREMRQLFYSYIDDGPIDIRSCFYGGRTGPLKLHHKIKDGERISYYDVTSLYPFINVTTSYPIGHPKVHIINKKVNWTSPNDNTYNLAILKVFVIPPRTIDVPVLPMKLENDARLLFPLCAKCAKMYPEGGVIENYRCTHNDEERGWVSTCTSIELNVALEENYIVTKLFRVLEYIKSDSELFQPYISEFMAEKIHSSGFDSNIKNNTQAEDQFIKECSEKFGIKIDRSKMNPNKGRRTQAKLMLNNLWGRFSLRNFGLSQCIITDDPEQYQKFINDKSIQITSLDELSPEILMIAYTKKKEWIEEHECSNIVISLWTTSAARIHLLRAMQQVVRTDGCTLLYTDTDSLIFTHPEGVNPLNLGPHLGQFTDEYPKHDIIEYVSGGAKQYGLKLKKKDNQQQNEHEYILKVRGITLNYDVVNNQGLRYETFKRQVIKYAKTGINEPIKIMYPSFLCPSIKNLNVSTLSRHKISRPFIGKGIVRPSDFSVLNFGHI